MKKNKVELIEVDVNNKRTKNSCRAIEEIYNNKTFYKIVEGQIPQRFIIKRNMVRWPNG